MPTPKTIRFTIRVKLLLLSIVILSVPYVGFEYLRELERYLRDSFEVSLLDTARSMAAPLHEKPSLFQLADDDELSSIYVHDLNHPIQIDGYDEDWLSYIAWSDTYPESSQDKPSFRMIISRHQQFFYVLLQVDDEKVVYQKQDAPDTLNNDHVMLVFTKPDMALEHYYFSPAAPGELRPFRFASYQDEFNFEYRKVEYVTNVRGEWQETESGYNLEIAIPIDQVGDQLGFVVSNFNSDEEDGVAMQTGTAGEGTVFRPGKLLVPSADIIQVIKNTGPKPGRRIWVLDNLGRVKASYGGLARDLSKETVNLFYTLVLPSVHERFRDDLAGASRLQGEEVKSALQGTVETRWRSSPDGKAIIVSAAVPVWIEEKVRGAVVVEETTTGMQILRRQATASLFNKTLIVFFLVTLVLFLFATRLSNRIRSLSLEAEQAIDEHGRVSGQFAVSKSDDEIGELSRSYASMLERLKEYNHYLENMSGRLSHELRTPIAVVQSSLDQLQSSRIDDGDAAYLGRAREGIERLSLIVTRLSEATRLEQALRDTEKREMNINELLSNCIEGYRAVYADTPFELELSEEEVLARVSPDLFVQMLDKLISNAVDFATPDTAVTVTLRQSEKHWQIEILNYGPGLPEQMEGQLFNSMVSVRDEKEKAQPHLGLGLYIARLVAEYHDAEIRAENLPAEKGVRFILTFRLSSEE